MALDIRYAGNTLATLTQDGTVIAATAGNYCGDNLTVECTDAIFTSMPPGAQYKQEWVFQDSDYFPRLTLSATFTDSPYITFRHRNIPSNLDKSKFTYEVFREGDTARQNLVRDVSIASATQINIQFGATHAFYLPDNMRFLAYYDGTRVAEYLISYGGYIRLTWAVADAANKKLFRAFWAYALAAQEIWG